MALDTTNTDPTYIFGRFWAICASAIEENNSTVSGTILAQLQANPLAGVALLHTKYLQHAQSLGRDRRAYYDRLISEVLNMIDGDNFVEGVLDRERQGVADVAYYHQRAAMAAR